MNVNMHMDNVEEGDIPDEGEIVDSNNDNEPK
jgi:hypothetical protein